ncbi:uncharacterized protein LOC133833115 [Humulus lupulus]|uniref:uncharacterized protein LOC133833115 n=1 Tax=Humulus lupulus TaxID=3486 RepID=UPI002B40938D|nr:uncharacterized protein LOC133833115 [Humulus lupulus]
MKVPKTITYNSLVDQLYTLIGADKSRIDLDLNVIYHFGSKGIPPSLISNDEDVAFFLDEIGTSINHRTPLCVSTTEKRSNDPLVTKTRELYTIPPVETKVNDDFCIDGNEDSCDDDNNDADGNEESFDGDNNDADDDNENIDRSTCNDVLVKHNLQQSTSNEVLKSHDSSNNRGRKVRQVGEDNLWSTPLLLNQGEKGSTSASTAQLLTSSSSINSWEIKEGQIFENKQELKMKLHLYALKKNFEFKVKKSAKNIWCTVCVDDKCKWRLRATKLVNSNMFEVRKFFGEHTCSLDVRHKDHRQASPWLIGHVIRRKFEGDDVNYKPRSIVKDMSLSYGVHMSYAKAWRCREHALAYIRGTPESSFQKLPSFLYMMEQKNPGTVTHLQMDNEGRFKYCFMALGVSIMGFKTYIRPVICVDGTFLTTRCGGTLLCAMGQDANKQIYPIAFSVVDSENNDSWLYFLLRLKEAIGEVENLVFVSDRHTSIASALTKNFPEAHHDACIHHVSMNIRAKFKTDHCHEEFFLAAKAYRKREFLRHFEKIKFKDLAIAQYLENQVGFEKWARSFFPGHRYNLMTTGIAESWNNVIAEARGWPITCLMEFMRHTLQKWFFERRTAASAATSPLATEVEADLRKLADKSTTSFSFPSSQYEITVLDGDLDGDVDLRRKTCSCRRFDLTGLPCEHALAGARDRGISPYSLCSRFYTVEAWLSSYGGSVYTLGNEESWVIPNDIGSMMIAPPLVKQKAGRPKKKRRLSKGEKNRKQHRCSRCGVLGHNRVTCTTVCPPPSRHA